MQSVPQEIMKMFHDVVEERNKLRKELESLRALLSELQEDDLVIGKNEHSVFKIWGFWKDTKYKFVALVTSAPETEIEDGMFYYNLTEEDIKEAIANGFHTELEFVISSYEKIS